MSVTLVSVVFLWLLGSEVGAVRTQVSAPRTPPRVVVDGTQLVIVENPPSLEDGEWWLRADPIAASLRMVLSFDPITSSVDVRDPLEGVARRYDGRSGQLTRDEITQMFLPSGLVAGTTSRDLRLPLPVLAALLDLEVWISPEADQISLTPRGNARRVRTESITGWRFRELRYLGAGNRYGESDRADLTVQTRSEIGPADLQTSLGFQTSTTEEAALRTGRASYSRNGRRIVAGDVGTTGLDWQRVSGRGIDWVEEGAGGRHRLSLSAVQQLTQSRSGGGALGTPDFDPWTVSLGFRTGAHAGAPVGRSLGFGVSWTERSAREDRSTLPFAAGEPSGRPSDPFIHILNELHYARTWAQLSARGGSAIAANQRSDYGWEVDGAFSPGGSLQIQGAAREFGPRFAPLSQGGATGTATRSIGASWSPWPRLQVRAFHSRLQAASAATSAVDPIEDELLEDTTGDTVDEGGGPGADKLAAGNSEDDATGVRSGWNEYNTGNVGLNLPTPWLRTVSLAASRTGASDDRRTSGLSSSARGQIRQVAWFWNGRHPLDEGDNPNVLTGGAAWSSAALGRLQIVHSWSRGVPAGGSWLFTPPILIGGRFQMTVGESWARANGGTTFRPFARIRWNLHPNHGLDLSVQESGDQVSARLAIRGSWGFGGGENGGTDPQTPGYLRHVGEVRGRLYLDHDLDGVFGSGDRPLRGVRVRLDRGRRTTETDDSGFFRFVDVSAGNHQVAVDPGTIRADYVLLDPMRREVTAGAFERRIVDFRVGVNRTIEGRIFYDRNDNGRWDEGETAAAEVHVVVSGNQDSLTYPDGSFRIGDVPPGRHVLRIDEASFDPNFEGPGSIELLVPSDRNPDPITVPLRLCSERVLWKQF